MYVCIWTILYSVCVFFRFDNYFVDVDATLEDFSGYIQTWSGFQKFKSVKGDDKAAEVINNFLKE